MQTVCLHGTFLSTPFPHREGQGVGLRGAAGRVHLPPPCVGVNLVAVDAGQLHVEDECGVGGDSRRCLLGSVVPQEIGHIDAPGVALHHVHHGCLEPADRAVDTHQRGHVNRLVERVAVVTAPEDVALRMGSRRDETSAVVYADAVVVLGQIRAGAGRLLVHIDIVARVVVFGEWCAEVVGAEGHPLAVGVHTAYLCDGVDVLVVALLPVVILACIRRFFAGGEAEQQAAEGEKAKRFHYFSFLSRLVMVTSSSMMLRSSLIFTRRCSIVSRSRSVTVSSWRVSKSTVTQ